MYYYVTNKLVLFFVRASIVYIFWIIRAPLLPTTTANNRQDTVFELYKSPGAVSQGVAS